MSEEKRRTENKAVSMRQSSASGRRSTEKLTGMRTAARENSSSEGMERYTRIVPSISQRNTEEQKKQSFAEKASAFVGTATRSSGSSARKQVEKRRLNTELLKKIGMGAAAVAVVVIIVILIIDSSKLKDVTKLEIELSTTTTQTLTWKGTKKGLSYELYQAESDGEYVLLDTVSGSENTKTIDGLQGGTLYRYKIVTVKKDKKTEGATVQGYTVPNRITNITTDTETKMALTITWSLKGNSAGYRLKWGVNPGLNDATTLSISDSEVTYNALNDTYSYILEGLAENGKYYMCIMAYCDENACSEWSDTFSDEVKKAVDMTGIDVDKPMIALTFNSSADNNEEKVTKDILRILQKYNFHATFFQYGDMAEEYSSMLTDIIDAGCEVGNLGYDHTSTESPLSDDIIKANDAIKDACGTKPIAYRPYYVPSDRDISLSKGVINTCESEDLAIYSWNISLNEDSADEIYEGLVNYANADGDIIILHNCNETTAEALDKFLAKVYEDGDFQIVTVSQLIYGRTGDMPQGGVIYKTGVIE